MKITDYYFKNMHLETTLVSTVEKNTYRCIIAIDRVTDKGMTPKDSVSISVNRQHYHSNELATYYAICHGDKETESFVAYRLSEINQRLSTNFVLHPLEEDTKDDD